MRKSFIFILALILTFSTLHSRPAQAEIPAKARAMMTIVGYGTAGGAILGAASMAFGTNSRAIAQGASLGLYAGILFGAYVLVSHHNSRYGSYDDNSSPYRQSNDIYGDEYRPDEGGSKGTEGESSGAFFDRYQTIKGQFNHKEKGGGWPPITMNLLTIQF